MIDEADTYTFEIVEERQYVSLVDSVMNPRVHLTVESIINDEYKFQNLKTAKYKFRIKAIKDGASSTWSKYKYADLTNASAIEVTYEDKGKDGIWYNVEGVRDNKGTGIRISPTKGKVFFSKKAH